MPPLSPGEGGIERDGEKAPLRHGLSVQSGGLLLYRAKGAADSDGGQLSRRAHGGIEVSGQGDTVVVVKGHLTMLHLAALGESLIPFLGQGQFLIHDQSLLNVGWTFLLFQLVE